MSNEFGKQNSLKQKSTGAADNLPISALNYEQLGNTAGLARDVVDKIITKILYVLGRAVKEGRKVSLLIHRIATITIDAGELKCDFMAEFLKDLRSPTVATRGSAQAPMVPGRTSKSVSSRTLRNTSTNTVIKPNVDVPKNSRSSSAYRAGRGDRGERTGEEGSERGGAQRPQSSQSTRSNSAANTITGNRAADIMNLMHSPRSVQNSSLGNAGLRKENLDKLQLENRGDSQNVPGGTNFRRFTRNAEGIIFHQSTEIHHTIFLLLEYN